MISKKMEKAINKQINAELYSAYLYGAMAAFFDSKNLEGFANWMKAQAQEEVAHAMRFYSYVFDAGGTVVLDAIEKPPASFGSPVKAFEETLKHERLVTSLINKLVDLARSESDHATENFLQWFVAEQVEEEATADAILGKLKLIGDHPNGLFMMNEKLGARAAGGAAGASAEAD